MDTTFKPYCLTNYGPNQYSQDPGHVVNSPLKQPVCDFPAWPLLIAAAAFSFIVKRLWFGLLLLAVVGHAQGNITVYAPEGMTISTIYFEDSSFNPTGARFDGNSSAVTLALSSADISGGWFNVSYSLQDANDVRVNFPATFGNWQVTLPSDTASLNSYASGGVLSLATVPEPSTNAFFFTGGHSAADLLYSSIASPFFHAIEFSIGAIATFVCIRWIRRGIIQRRNESGYAEYRRAKAIGMRNGTWSRKYSAGFREWRRGRHK
jgi:hypothetical protein